MGLKSILFLCLTLAGTRCGAQKWSTILNTDELEKQKQVMVEKFPDLFVKEKIISVEKNDADNYRITYTQNGVYCQAFISSERGERGMLLIETDQLIPENKIPGAIKAGLSFSNYKNWKIDKAFKASTPSSGILYRVDIYKNAAERNKIKTLYFNDMGQFHAEPPK